MTPTIATIAVCAAAEILPAPIAVPIIDAISEHFERVILRRAVAETRRLAAERDAAVTTPLYSPKPKHRRPIPFFSTAPMRPIRTEEIVLQRLRDIQAATIAEEEMRLAAQFEAQAAKTVFDEKRLRMSASPVTHNQAVFLRSARAAQVEAKAGKSGIFVEGGVWYQFNPASNPASNMVERLAFEEIARNDPHMKRA